MLVTGKERVNSWSIDLTLLTRSKKLGRVVDELQKRERVATKQLKNRNEKTIWKQIETNEKTMLLRRIDAQQKKSTRNREYDPSQKDRWFVWRFMVDEVSSASPLEWKAKHLRSGSDSGNGSPFQVRSVLHGRAPARSLPAAKWAIFCKFCKILAGSFSAVSKRNFARKYAFDSIFQALQDLHTFTPLQSQNFSEKIGLKISNFRENSAKILQMSQKLQNFAKFQNFSKIIW